MDDLTYDRLMEIIVRSLNHMDDRLTGHGERIAYGMMRLLQRDPRFSPEEICKLIWITLLHDIGNFQGLSIGELLKREFDSPHSHAKYGYLFLKHLGPYPEYAPIVLYHHSGREEIDASDMGEPLKWVAKCMMALDTLDLYQIGTPSLSKEQLSELLTRLDTSRYDQSAIEAVHALLLETDQPSCQEAIHQALLTQLGQVEIGQEEKHALLHTLISSIDFRSHSTALHCAIMVRVSDLLAELCGLDEEDRQAVHVGAILHDLGKIGIPTRILEYPGKLEGKDWERMKSHVCITEEILQGEVSDRVLQIAVRHHETLDGAGYPRGLDARSLTLPQRIVAVADIVSALSEERSYKAAFPLEEVLNILEGMCKRGKLCPQVIGVLRDHRERIYAEARRAGDETHAIYDRIHREFATSMRGILSPASA